MSDIKVTAEPDENSVAIDWGTKFLGHTYLPRERAEQLRVELTNALTVLEVRDYPHEGLSAAETAERVEALEAEGVAVKIA